MRMSADSTFTSHAFDWLIIGGGIHGVHIAARLIGEGGVPAERVGILDPADALLARWRAFTATTGMTHLRSPAVHHLDLDAWSLKHFAGKRKARKAGLFASPYGRPSLDLFNRHCDRVIETFGLAERHIRDRAVVCTVDCDGVAIRTAAGLELEARNVVLAIGASEQPQWPDWAPPEHPRVHHVFASNFDGWPCNVERVAVVGGGISAAQVALRLANEGHAVHLVSRHALRQHQFDSNPGWLGPRFMAGFTRERDLDRRRKMISDARYRGSVPPDIHRALRRAIAAQQITWHEATIDDLVVANNSPARPACEPNSRLTLRLTNDGRLEDRHAPSDLDRVLLATGFTPHRPGGAMIDQLIDSAALPCARCGYPKVDAALRWHARVYVSGPLAELELGPVARNIAGARRAGDRLIHALRSELPSAKSA
jgi:glycine/D-amino acid oxidase-like deaminating enzyme